MNNNMVVDLLEELRYVRYIDTTGRCVLTDKFSANGIIGSDGNTVYHLLNTDGVFPEATKSVRLEVTDEETYRALAASQTAAQNETVELKNRVSSLEALVEQQNQLLTQLLNKLNT